MRKKILHIVNKSSYDGVTSYTTRLIKHLPQYHHQIVSCYKGDADQKIKGMNIDFTCLLNSHSISYWYLLFKYIRMISFLRKNRFDIIHYHNGGIGLVILSVWLSRKEKVIYHIHSGNVVGDPSKLNIPLTHKLILKYLKNKTIKIAVAEHILNKYETSIGSTNNLKLIPNAVPFSFNKRNSLNHSIGYIGREEKLKGYNAFIRIINELSKDNKLIYFYKMGNFVGSQKNINQQYPSFNVEWFYKKIDLLIFLSTANEGLPLTILEALSFDIGVIAHPIDAVVEILGKHYPLLVESEKEAVDMINKFYSNEFDKEGLSNIHSECSAKFSYNKMINQLKQIYEQ